MKNTLKDMLDNHSDTSRSFLIKISIPIILLCRILKNHLDSMETSSQSSFSSTPSSAVNPKIFTDILVVLWESYFCKHLV